MKSLFSKYILEMISNGVTVRRNRAHRTIEIHSIDHNTLSARIPNYTCRVGDTIIEINGRNVTSMTLPEINGILRNCVLRQINTISHLPRSHFEIYENGITIRRSRNNRRTVEIHSINNNILRNLIPNYTCQVGDSIMAINNVNIVGMAFSVVEGLLRSEQLHSISTQRTILATPENGIDFNFVSHDIPVQNRSYNQLLQGQ